jgi:hypothetical protein
MKFDLIATNPPFQDTGARGKTPHKLWIEFTKKTFSSWLQNDGYLAQVSPSSFRSPNSAVLEILKEKDTLLINFDSGKYFPGVGSTFADYIVRNSPRTKTKKTKVTDGETSSMIVFDETLLYLPNRLDSEALSIHQKVMFKTTSKMNVNWDYVTCHNILLKKSDTLSKVQTERHCHPVLHTNKQIWWSSLKQPFADLPKVMWSRSGYTTPFFDPGELGGTDMVYYVPVENEQQGERLTQALNSKLFQYIFTTGKWSGFGNERVFRCLPELELSTDLDDANLYQRFKLTKKEIHHVEEVMD